MNEILFQGLRANNRLATVALVYGNRDGEELTTPAAVLAHAEQYRNLAVLGPDRASYGGVSRPWDSASLRDGDQATYWNADEKRFALGDFTTFAAWIERYLFGQSLVPPEAPPVGLAPSVEA